MLWVPDMQKIEIFWGYAPDPTEELTALLPSWCSVMYWPQNITSHKLLPIYTFMCPIIQPYTADTHRLK